MMFFGAGSVVSGVVNGIVQDKIGPKKSALLTTGIIIVMTIITVFNVRATSEFGWLSYLMCFIWGFQDTCGIIFTSRLCGFEFENHSEPFSVFNFVQGVVVFAFQIV